MLMFTGPAVVPSASL